MLFAYSYLIGMLNKGNNEELTIRSLMNIAYINLNKRGGLGRTVDKKLKKYIEKYKWNLKGTD